MHPQDPATAEIRPGKETTIEIVKEKMGLGLSIVGGSDTLLVSNVHTIMSVICDIKGKTERTVQRQLIDARNI